MADAVNKLLGVRCLVFVCVHLPHHCGHVLAFVQAWRSFFGVTRGCVGAGFGRPGPPGRPSAGGGVECR